MAPGSLQAGDQRRKVRRGRGPRRRGPAAPRRCLYLKDRGSHLLSRQYLLARQHLPALRARLLTASSRWSRTS